MTTTQACVRGCSLYRRHLEECVSETCPGCLPRRAEHGHLCWPCHRRLQLMLTDAPTVHRWLTGNMSTGEGAARMKQDFERSGGGMSVAWSPPAPVKVEILDVRDLLGDRLTLWADEWAEHHKVTSPKHSVEADVEFLLRWLPGIEALDWIGDWWEELAETMRDAHALAPWRPVMRRCPGIPCPDCEQQTLVIQGGSSDVFCLTCKLLIPENRYGIWVQILKEDPLGA